MSIQKLVSNNICEAGDQNQLFNDTDLLVELNERSADDICLIIDKPNKLKEAFEIIRNMVGTKLSEDIVIKRIKNEIEASHYPFHDKKREDLLKLVNLSDEIALKYSLTIQRLVFDIFLKEIVKTEIKNLFNEKIKEGFFGNTTITKYYVKVKLNEKHKVLRNFLSLSFNHKRSKIDITSYFDKIEQKDFNFPLRINDPVNYIDLSTNHSLSRYSSARAYLVSLDSLNRAYEDVGDRIFDENIRYFVEDKSIDNALSTSIIRDEYDFQIFHNGITIGCDDFQCGGSEISIDNGYILNGAQTIYNINKLAKFNIINSTDLGKRFVLAKIIKRNQISSDDSLSEIRISANRQKKIFAYDLKANDANISVINEGLKKEGYRIKAKRGEPDQLRHEIKIYDAAKIIYSCIFQQPGFARMSSYEYFFNNKEIYDDLFSVEPHKESRVNLIYIVMKIHEKLVIARNIITDKSSDKYKYGEKYYTAYIFGKLFEEHQNILRSKTSDIDSWIESDFTRLFEEIDLSLERFINAGTNGYKKDENYVAIFKNCMSISEKILESINTEE